MNGMAARALADLLMPRECLVCGKILRVNEKHLCIWCASDLPLTYYWERKHNPMADRFNQVLENFRQPWERIEYAWASALIFYHKDNPYRQIPQALKYDYDIAAGQFFASYLGVRMMRQPHFCTVDTVVPVPLHWLRRWKRGYNQAEVIAREIAAALGARMLPHALKRQRNTSSQTAFGRESRLANVKNVFGLKNPAQLAGASHVLLVDDTFTTGATLAGCYLALKEALGPGVRISVATLAVVED